MLHYIIVYTSKSLGFCPRQVYMHSNRSVGIIKLIVVTFFFFFISLDTLRNTSGCLRIQKKIEYQSTLRPLVRLIPSKPFSFTSDAASLSNNNNCEVIELKLEDKSVPRMASVPEDDVDNGRIDGVVDDVQSDKVLVVVLMDSTEDSRYDSGPLCPAAARPSPLAPLLLLLLLLLDDDALGIVLGIVDLLLEA